MIGVSEKPASPNATQKKNKSDEKEKDKDHQQQYHKDKEIDITSDQAFSSVDTSARNHSSAVIDHNFNFFKFIYLQVI